MAPPTVISRLVNADFDRINGLFSFLFLVAAAVVAIEA
jgi:hypothetical protein